MQPRLAVFSAEGDPDRAALSTDSNQSSDPLKRPVGREEEASELLMRCERVLGTTAELVDELGRVQKRARTML